MDLYTSSVQARGILLLHARSFRVRATEGLACAGFGAQVLGELAASQPSAIARAFAQVNLHTLRMHAAGCDINAQFDKLARPVLSTFTTVSPSLGPRGSAGNKSLQSLKSTASQLS